MLPNYVSIGHTNHRVSHKLVEFGNAWWDHARQHCGIFLDLNRLKRATDNVEQLLIDRPLTVSSNDAADLEAITSSHLVLGLSIIDHPNLIFNGG